MNVKELIAMLEKIEDKELEVMFDDVELADFENFWIHIVEEIPTGTSGYEHEGCVVLGGFDWSAHYLKQEQSAQKERT